MKKALKYITMTLLTIEITLLCLFLPSKIAKWQDQQSFGAVHLEKTEDIKVEQNQQMTMLEKLSLFINQENTSNQISIKQGKYKKEEEIPGICEKELKQLEELGILNSIDVDIQSNTPQIQLTFYLSLEDPTKSMIVWNVGFTDGKSYVSISLDDETGKILSFTEKTNEVVVNTDVDDFMKGVGQYYGLTVNDYQYKVLAYDYIKDKRMLDSMKIDKIREAYYVATAFSEGNNQLNCGILLYPYGWYYSGY